MMMYQQERQEKSYAKENFISPEGSREHGKGLFFFLERFQSY
jgi:hypothetical protein